MGCRGAVWCARTDDLMGLLQRGEVDAGFIGGAEIDRHGNLNTTAIGADRTHPSVQLPGSGGGAGPGPIQAVFGAFGFAKRTDAQPDRFGRPPRAFGSGKTVAAWSRTRRSGCA